MYDYETNQCRDLKKVLSDEDVKEIESGMFSNWIEPDGKAVEEDVSSHDVSCYILLSL